MSAFVQVFRAGTLALAFAVAPSPNAVAGGDPADALDQARTLQHDDPPTALALVEGALPDPAVAADPALHFELLHLRAGIMRDRGRTDAALADAARIDSLARETGDRLMAARSLYLRGTILAEEGDIAGALEAFHGAREGFAETGARSELARATNAIGIAYNFINDVPRGRTYIEQALEIARDAGDEESELLILGNLALAVSALDGPEAGLPYHFEALEIGRERGHTQAVTYQLASICSGLVAADRLDEAVDTCADALEHARSLGHVRLLAGVELSVGDLLRARGSPHDALARYEQARLTDGRQDSKVALETSEKMAAIHEELGNHAEALEHYRRAVALRDRMLDDERRGLIEELDVRFEVHQRDREIDLLQHNADLQARGLELRNWLLLGMGGALVLTIVLVSVAWRAYRIKARLERQLAARNRELEGAIDTIGRLARADSLTGLLNRRAFLDVARREHARAQRDGTPLTVVVADIDDFKPLNDRYGHHLGDEVLVEIASRLKANLREVDAVCRWGGEEFVLLLPGTDIAGARDAMERRRRVLAAEPVRTGEGELKVTMTFGIAAVGDDLDAAIQAADTAMYEGKRAGRNRVVVNG